MYDVETKAHEIAGKIKAKQLFDLDDVPVHKIQAVLDRVFRLCEENDDEGN